MATSGIYMIKNNRNGKCYVGKAHDIEKRWATHKKLLNIGEHYNKLIQEDYNKDKEWFEYSILEEVHGSTNTEIERILRKREKYWGDFLDVKNKEKGYNIGKFHRTVKEVWEEMDKTGFVLNGFVKADNWNIREIINKADAQTAMLYLIILSHRNTQTNECFPSISLLKEEMGVSTSTLKNMLDKLYDMEAIQINSGRQGIANNYYFPAEDFYDQNCMESLAVRKTKAFIKAK